MRREITAPGVAAADQPLLRRRRGQRLPVRLGLSRPDANGNLVGGDDTVAQCEQVLKNLGAILAAGGCTPADVVKVNVYLTNVDDRPLINPLRQAFFGDVAPRQHARRREGAAGAGHEGRDRGGGGAAAARKRGSSRSR